MLYVIKKYKDEEQTLENLPTVNKKQKKKSIVKAFYYLCLKLLEDVKLTKPILLC